MRQSIITIPSGGIGEVSDGYHTFNELYHHRAILFSVICNQNQSLAWKSKSHEDGTMYANMFIVGINTPQGQATYHYDVNPYWDMFNVIALDNAPKWDGHTPAQAIERILQLGIVKVETFHSNNVNFDKKSQEIKAGCILQSEGE